MRTLYEAFGKTFSNLEEARKYEQKQMRYLEVEKAYKNYIDIKNKYNKDFGTESSETEELILQILG